MIAKKRKEILQKITNEINNEYSFHDGILRINYGPVAFLLNFLQKMEQTFQK